MSMPTLMQLRLGLAAGAFVVALSGGVAAADKASTVSTPDLSAVHIDNFGQIDATYYRGAQPENGVYATLVALGVKTVVNLTSNDADPAERGLVEKAGMQYVQIPMTVHTPPTAE